MASSQTSRASRTFIDSSILIAAAISPTGDGRALLLAAIHAQVPLFWSDLVVTETERNLAKKAPAAIPAYQILRDTLPITIVNPPLGLVLDVARVIAPKDAPIVAAALHSRADYLVTLDRKHLLSQADTVHATYSLALVPPIAVLQQIRNS
jgi:predicted nucleic acid-binding protein